MCKYKRDLYKTSCTRGRCPAELSNFTFLLLHFPEFFGMDFRANLNPACLLRRTAISTTNTTVHILLPTNYP